MRIGYWQGYGDVEFIKPKRIDPGDGEILITVTKKSDYLGGAAKDVILKAASSYWCDDTLVFYCPENF